MKKSNTIRKGCILCGGFLLVGIFSFSTIKATQKDGIEWCHFANAQGCIQSWEENQQVSQQQNIQEKNQQVLQQQSNQLETTSMDYSFQNDTNAYCRNTTHGNGQHHESEAHNYTHGHHGNFER